VQLGVVSIRVISDLHVHSRYSRATSQRLCIKEIDRFAGIKGLNLIGTGDFTHPEWFKELRASLVHQSDSGLYKYVKNPQSLIHDAIRSSSLGGMLRYSCCVAGGHCSMSPLAVLLPHSVPKTDITFSNSTFD